MGAIEALEESMTLSSAQGSELFPRCGQGEIEVVWKQKFILSILWLYSDFIF